MGKIIDIVKLQPLHDAETIPQRRGQQPRAGGGSHESKRRQVEFNRSRGGPLTNHDIQLIVFHRRVEHLLNIGTQSVDFINKQDIPRFKISHQGGNVSRFLQDRAAGRFE